MRGDGPGITPSIGAVALARAGADRQLVQEKCVKYTIRDGVIFDSQALLRDVREMVEKAKAGNW